MPVVKSACSFNQAHDPITAMTSQARRGPSVDPKDIAGARFVSRVDARMPERVSGGGQCF